MCPGIFRGLSAYRFNVDVYDPFALGFCYQPFMIATSISAELSFVSEPDGAICSTPVNGG
jgi:hypothetical protein